MIEREINKVFEPIIKKDNLMLKETKKQLGIFKTNDCFLAAYGSCARMVPAKEVDKQVFLEKNHSFSKAQCALAIPDKGCETCKLKDINELKNSYKVSLKQITRIIDLLYLSGNKKKFDLFVAEITKTVLEKKKEIILLALLVSRQIHYMNNSLEIKSGKGGKRDIDYIFFMENIISSTKLNAPKILSQMNKGKILTDKETREILKFYSALDKGKMPTKSNRKKISKVYLKYRRKRVLPFLAKKIKTSVPELELSFKGKYFGKSEKLRFANDLLTANFSAVPVLDALLKKNLKKITLESWCILMNIANNPNITESMAFLMSRKFRNNISMRHIRIALIKNNNVHDYIKQEMLLHDPCRVAMQNVIGKKW